MKKELTFHHDEFKNISDECKNFIKAFLKKDPNERIRLEDAVKDPWFEITSEIIAVDIESTKEIVSKIEN